jgi:Mycothiol maleylpyruvate isomerase N-terminal domain
VLTGFAAGPSLLSVNWSFVAQNARELERLRELLSRLSDEDLGAMVNEYWTVAGVLGHLTFWDGRALFFAGKLERGQPFTASDGEPGDVDWINDATRPLIHAIPPREAAELALRVAEETDRAVASLSPELVASINANTPLNPLRADHRGDHLDEIEAALSARAKR